MNNVDEMILRRSIVVMLLEIIFVQIFMSGIYLFLRFTKFWGFNAFVVENDLHELNFWIGIFIFIILITLQSIAIISIILKWWFESYEITIDSIIHKRGVFRRKEDIYSLKNIEAGNVTQTIPGKILNYGTIGIYSPVLKREYFIRDISSPHLVKNTIVDLIDKKIELRDKKIIPREINKI